MGAQIPVHVCTPTHGEFLFHSSRRSKPSGVQELVPIILYRRSLQVESVRALYDSARQLMRYLYFYRKTYIQTNILSYNPEDPDWLPEDCPKFSLFLDACLLAKQEGLSPKQYLEALLEYRTYRKDLRYPLDERAMFNGLSPFAVDFYISEHRIFGKSASYIASKISDPVEDGEAEYRTQKYSWEQIGEGTQTDRETLEKVFLLNLQGLFSRQFLELIPEFVTLFESKQIIEINDQLIWPNLTR